MVGLTRCDLVGPAPAQAVQVAVRLENRTMHERSPHDLKYDLKSYLCIVVWALCTALSRACRN